VAVPSPDVEDRVVVRISARSAVIAVAVVGLAVVAQRVFVAAHAPLSWAVAAAVVAVLIDPIVDVLDRHVPRLVAVIVALLVLGVGTWLVVYVAFDNLSEGVEQLGEAAQDAADELESRDDGVGQTAQDIDASRRVELFVDALDERVTGGDDVLASTAGVAPTYFLGGILTLFLMSYGPRLAQSAVDQVADERRRTLITGVVTSALQRSRRAVLLTIAEGFAIGLAVAGVAALLDIPAPVALGLAAGIMALLPHVGLVLGTLPLVLLVLARRSDLATVVTVAVILVCQLLDSYWVRRRIELHSVHVGLLVPWVVALVGYAVYGVGGAAYALALAIFGMAVLDEISRRTDNPAPITTLVDEVPDQIVPARPEERPSTSVPT
jgi:predicted PurR-regulated permease PerM